MNYPSLTKTTRNWALLSSFCLGMAATASAAVLAEWDFEDSSQPERSSTPFGGDAYLIDSWASTYDANSWSGGVLTWKQTGVDNSNTRALDFSSWSELLVITFVITEVDVTGLDVNHYGIRFGVPGGSGNLDTIYFETDGAGGVQIDVGLIGETFLTADDVAALADPGTTATLEIAFNLLDSTVTYTKTGVGGTLSNSSPFAASWTETPGSIKAVGKGGGGISLDSFTIETRDAPEVVLWAGYPVTVDENGSFADTGDWLGWLALEFAPWVYCFDIESWMYLPEAAVKETGAWMYIAQ
jgi:hypothetical protein